MLLSVCRHPNCGSVVERSNMKIIRNGAKIKVNLLCNNSHKETWDSSPSIGTGTRQVAEINVLIAVYSLLTGLHIKQVKNSIAMIKI